MTKDLMGSFSLDFTEAAGILEIRVIAQIFLAK
jgi:hypothetical protein